MAGDRTPECVWGWQGQLKAIADRTKHILQKDTFSDVTFRVGPLEGPTVDMKAHKLMLAMGSAVFETMFYGSIAETSTIVRITDMDEKTFGILLRYIYCDEMPRFDSATAFSTLYTAKKYGLPLLKAACEDFLKKHANSANCLAGFVQAKAYDEQDLANFFLGKIDSWAVSIFESADFVEIGIDSLKEIFSRDTLRVKEAEVLNAAYRWAQHRCDQRKIAFTGKNCRDMLEDAMFLIRFPLLEDKDLAIAAKDEFLLAEEFRQLYLFRFINEKLTAKFISKKRITPVLVKICRFDSDRVGYGEYYEVETPDIIRLSVTSVTSAQGKKLDSATVSLFAIGIFGPSSESQISRFSAVIRIYQHCEATGKAKEMQEFCQTVALAGDGLADNRNQLQLKKAVPLAVGQSYFVSVQVMGAREASYDRFGSRGKESVTALAGEYSVTVRFWDAIDPEGYGWGTQNASATQFPEFYLEVAG